MDDHVQQILIDRHAIARRIDELAAQIADDLQREAMGDVEPQVTLVAVLTGSLIFVADLIRKMPLMMRIRLIAVSSYGPSTTPSSELRIRGELPEDMVGQHVLIVDDILDSGRTISLVQQLVRDRRPASMRTCMLLRKDTPEARAAHADYIGFDIPNEFIVGYGLDFNGHYRNLPDIVTLKPQYLKNGT